MSSHNKSNNDILVKVEDVGKKFCRDLKKSLWYGIKDIGNELLVRNNNQMDLRPKEFWANQGVSFELKRGDVLGLIGRNGAGKTTLLKILNGLIKPDRGKITINGSVGALIALGAGFNPILTGRENIYINGSILGLTKKEIDKRFDEIVEFADLWDFIDTPVQSYSSGMQVRLGFSIATNLEPDVLIIDEVLAVGDAPFRSKCYNQVGKLAKNAAVIFVSHNMNDIARICDKTLLLKNGKVTHFGDVETGIEKYQKNLGDDSIVDESFTTVEAPVKHVEFKWSTLEINYGETLKLTIKVDVFEDMNNIQLIIPFYSNEGFVVAEWLSRSNNIKINLQKGINTINVTLGPLYLKNGNYKIAIAMSDNGIRYPVWSYKNYTLQVSGLFVGSYAYQIPALID